MKDQHRDGPGDRAPAYEVHAIKYAELKGRPATDIFLGVDPHEAAVDMDYFVWLIRSAERTIVVDMGFTAEVAAKRGRTFLRCPGEGLRCLGVDPWTVTDVVVTHLHYDHVGNYALFPAARFHVQDREVAFATGRMMRHRCLCAAYEPDDVAALVKTVFQGRVEFHDGDEEIAPGISVHLAPGHTAGLQFVRVATRKGWLVLASDACHYGRHLDENLVFPLVTSVPDLMEGYRRLRKLASDRALIVPGHDPAVMTSYPRSLDDQALCVRLD
ncbi:N-acyl homoserine lactonase family protein [Methylobacterium pseudosasicola]|uniref:Glyoxylase, beta-lactamase superfamily II n=1 Tax=Methylobacterium pseudosasicola TaxID=582667 RepID=A0A1I4NJH9_9HYPH|nr:N-acyl homoserine lactonase family protein [Methylobacterium pseudosasicola]SFM15619.1 Glyoxylase, beta-lactamase superfamily II [Methylobacterium pseudosasicola]